MLPNAGDDRTGANPTVRGFVGIVIVESAAGGVGAIEGIPCSAAGRVGDRFIDLTVGDGGEGSGLVDDAGDAVGEGGGFHPIEDNGTDSDLTDIRFSAGFGEEEEMPISSRVFRSATPVADRPCFFWKRLTASVVWEP